MTGGRSIDTRRPFSPYRWNCKFCRFVPMRRYTCARYVCHCVTTYRKGKQTHLQYFLLVYSDLGCSVFFRYRCPPWRPITTVWNACWVSMFCIPSTFSSPCEIFVFDLYELVSLLFRNVGFARILVFVYDFFCLYSFCILIFFCFVEIVDFEGNSKITIMHFLK